MDAKRIGKQLVLKTSARKGCRFESIQRPPFLRNNSMSIFDKSVHATDTYKRSKNWISFACVGERPKPGSCNLPSLLTRWFESNHMHHFYGILKYAIGAHQCRPDARSPGYPGAPGKPGSCAISSIWQSMRFTSVRLNVRFVHRVPYASVVNRHACPLQLPHHRQNR